MVLPVVDRYLPDRFEQAFPCATGGLSLCERHPRWQAGGKAPVSDRLENPPSSSTAGMPRYRDRWRPCAAGVVPPALQSQDCPQLTPPMDPEVLVDEIARLGFSGSQLSRALPAGAALLPALKRRGLRIAEVYAALPCTSKGPTPEARH